MTRLEDLFRMPDGPILAIVQDFRGEIIGRSALVLSHTSGLRLRSSWERWPNLPMSSTWK